MATARHQTMAGNDINAEQSHKLNININALRGVIRDGYVIGSVIAQ